jgi:hypothetical protein
VPAQQTDLDITPVEYAADSLQSPPYYGYRVSWTPGANRPIALEVEFIHMKVFARTDRRARVHGTWHGRPVDGESLVGAVVQRLAMSHGLNFVLANVALRRDVGKGLRAVVRAGAGPTVPHVETTIDGLSRDQYASGGLGAQAAGGVEATLVTHVLVLAEYKFTWASPTIDVASGRATIPARTHHVVAGLAYRF